MEEENSNEMNQRAAASRDAELPGDVPHGQSGRSHVVELLE